MRFFAKKARGRGEEDERRWTDGEGGKRERDDEVEQVGEPRGKREG